MALVVVGSVHGSPGATTTACGLAAALAAGSAWGRAGLVEADADGGVLAARFAALRADRTLVDLAAATRLSLDDDEVASIAQRMWGAVDVVVAPPSPDEASSALRAGSARLASAFAASDRVWIVDVGRIRPDGPAMPLLQFALAVVVACAPTFEQVAVAGPRVAELARRGTTATVVCVGDGSYPATEVAATLGAPLVGVIPWDPRAVARFSGGRVDDRRLRSSLWWRSMCALGAIVDRSSGGRTVPESVASEPVVRGQR